MSSNRDEHVRQRVKCDFGAVQSWRGVSPFDTLPVPVHTLTFSSQHRWWKEPALNLIAAAAQLSSYTHVELSIGEAVGDGGQMANVARIYNDNLGVELCQRTGRNPSVSCVTVG